MCRHQGRNPLNEMAIAAKAGTLRALRKTIAPYLLVASYPTAYALDSFPTGLFTPPRAPEIMPMARSNANTRMANRTQEVSKRFNKIIDLTRIR